MNSKSFFKHNQFFISGLCFTTVCLGIIFILGSLGWPGPMEPCLLEDRCYCEHMERSAIIRQPVNTWTNLLAVSLGLGVLWKFDHDDKTRTLSSSESSNQVPTSTGQNSNEYLESKGENPMRSRTIYSGLYGHLMIFVGTGSMFFHASGMWYGGLLDNISMQAFVSFLIIYNFQRIYNFSEKKFLTFWITLNIIMGVTVKMPGVFLGHVYFGTMVFIIIIIEPIMISMSHLSPNNRLRVKFRRNWRLYILSLSLFIVAYIFWSLSSFGSPLCFPNWPESLWQGHGFWHYLVAITTLTIYYYLRSETPI